MTFTISRRKLLESSAVAALLTALTPLSAKAAGWFPLGVNVGTPPPSAGIPFWGNPGDQANYIKPDYSAALGASGLYAGDPTPTITVAWRDFTTPTNPGPQPSGPGAAADFYTVFNRSRAGVSGGGVWVITANSGYVHPNLQVGALLPPVTGPLLTWPSLGFIAGTMVSERSGTLIVPAGYYTDLVNISGANDGKGLGFTSANGGNTFKAAYPSWTQANPAFGHIIIRGAVWPANSGTDPTTGMKRDGQPATYLKQPNNSDTTLGCTEETPAVYYSGQRFIFDVRNFQCGQFPVVVGSKVQFYFNAAEPTSNAGSGYADGTYNGIVMDDGPQGGSGLIVNIIVTGGKVTSCVLPGATANTGSVYDVGNPAELGYQPYDLLTSNNTLEPNSLIVRAGGGINQTFKTVCRLGEATNDQYGGGGIGMTTCHYAWFYARNVIIYRGAQNGGGSTLDGTGDDLVGRENSKWVLWDCQTHFSSGTSGSQHNLYLHSQPVTFIRCWGTSSKTHNWKCETDYVICLNSIPSCEPIYGPRDFVGSNGRPLEVEGPASIYCYQNVFTLRINKGNQWNLECGARNTQQNISTCGTRRLTHILQDSFRDPTTGKYTDTKMFGDTRHVPWKSELTAGPGAGGTNLYIGFSKQLCGQCGGSGPQSSVVGTGAATQSLKLHLFTHAMAANQVPAPNLDADVGIADAYTFQVMINDQSDGTGNQFVHSGTATLNIAVQAGDRTQPTWTINPGIPANRWIPNNNPIWFWARAGISAVQPAGGFIDKPLLNPKACNPNDPAYPWRGLIRSTRDAAGLRRINANHHYAIPVTVDSCVFFPYESLLPDYPNHWIEPNPLYWGADWGAEQGSVPNMPWPPVRATNGEYADVAGMSYYIDLTTNPEGMQSGPMPNAVAGTGGPGLEGSDFMTLNVLGLRDCMQDYSRAPTNPPAGQIYYRDNWGALTIQSRNQDEYMIDARYIRPDGTEADIPKSLGSSLTVLGGLANTTTTASAAANATSVTVASTTGIAVGKRLSVLMDGGPYAREWYFTTVSSVAGNVIGFKAGDKLPFSSPSGANVAVCDASGANPSWWPNVVDWFYNNVQNRP